MKLKLVIILSVLVAATMRAQETYTIPLSFSVDDFSFEQRDNQLYIESMALPVTFDSDTLSPALPYVCTTVLIGPSDTYNGFSYAASDSLVGENISLPHNPVAIPTNVMPSSYQPVEMDYGEGTYPQDKVKFTGVHNVGGYQLACFLVCPFRYDAANRKLFFDSHIDLSLNLSTASNNNIQPASYLKGSTIRGDISSMVVNPEELNVSYPVTPLLKAFPGVSECHLKYLIVTCDSLKDEFQKLADWKTEKGYRAQIITVEDIYSQYSGRNKPLQIKNALYDYYQASDGDLEFVLLGGGVNIVPEQKCYAEIQLGNEEEIGNTASDIFYSCFGVMDWDKNLNNKYAELEDSVSLSQNVSLTRLPVNSLAATRHIVGKIIEYERNPNISDWNDEFLMCGVKGYKYIGADRLSDTQILSERLYSSCISGKWKGDKYRFYDTFTDHANGANYDVTADNLQSELSKGYPMVMVNTHGDYYGWLMETGSMYLYADAKSLVSPNYTCIFTLACHTNNIHYPDHSLGCSFLNNVNCGVISYIGSTNLGFSSKFGLLAYTDKSLGEIFKNISGEQQLGKAVYEMKMKHLADCNSYNYNRWDKLYLLPLCDPEMPVYLERPQTFSLQDVTHKDSAVTISMGYRTGRICVMNRHDGVSSHYTSFSDYGLQTVYCHNVESQLCLTFPNYRAFRAIFAPTVNLQNEALADNMNVLADDVHIGSNIVSDRDSGPVIVENGESVISSHNGTTIYNDFEVKLGASLLITSD